MTRCPSIREGDVRGDPGLASRTARRTDSPPDVRPRGATVDRGGPGSQPSRDAGPGARKLRRLDEESRRNLEHHIAVGNDLDEKASEVFRFNALVIGVVVSAASILLKWGGTDLTLEDWVLMTLLFGLFSLLFSLIFAITAYWVTEYAVGLRSEDILNALDEQFEPSALLDAIAFRQAKGAILNRINVDKTAKRLKIALSLLVVGLLGLIASATGLLAYNYTP